MSGSVVMPGRGATTGPNAAVSGSTGATLGHWSLFHCSTGTAPGSSGAAPRLYSGSRAPACLSLVSLSSSKALGPLEGHLGNMLAKEADFLIVETATYSKKHPYSQILEVKL